MHPRATGTACPNAASQDPDVHVNIATDAEGGLK